MLNNDAVPLLEGRFLEGRWSSYSFHIDSEDNEKLSSLCTQATGHRDTDMDLQTPSTQPVLWQRANVLDKHSEDNQYQGVYSYYFEHLVLELIVPSVKHERYQWNQTMSAQARIFWYPALR